MKGGRRRAIIVLGMHRSGTSALAGVLGLLGIKLPARLMPASPQNPKGYFEPYHLVAIHERILAAAGTTWSAWEKIPEAWFSSAASDTFVDEIVTEISEDYGVASLFVVKDPRICRLMPLWYRVLDRIDATPSFVISFRNPLEVANSMQKRDGLPITHGCLLWLRYVLDAERHTRGHPRVFIRYRDLLAEPRSTIDRIGAELTIKWPRQIKSRFEEIENFLDLGLRTQIAEERDFDDMGDFSPWLRQANESHQALVRTPVDNVAIQQLNSLYAAFAASDAAFTSVLRYLAEQHSIKLATLRETLGEQQNELAKLGRAIVERDDRIATLGNSLVELNTRLSTLRHNLAEHHGELNVLRNALTEKSNQVTVLDNTLVVQNTRLATLGEAVRLRDKLIAKLRCENAVQQRSLFRLKDDNIQLIDVANTATQRLKLIKFSTTWRASLHLRRAFAGLPSPIRRGGRHVFTALGWILTPHRIPGRLRELRAQRNKPLSSPEP